MDRCAANAQRVPYCDSRCQNFHRWTYRAQVRVPLTGVCHSNITLHISQRNGFAQWTEGKIDDIGAFALAGVGIYTQIFVFPFLPFLVKLLLFPATFTEWILTMFVSAAV